MRTFTRRRSYPTKSSISWLHWTYAFKPSCFYRRKRSTDVVTCGCDTKICDQLNLFASRAVGQIHPTFQAHSPRRGLPVSTLRTDRGRGEDILTLPFVLTSFL